MIFIYAFLFSGIVCLISQIILDNTKLTPGHVTSLFVVIGAFLLISITLVIILQPMGVLVA